MPSTSRPLGEFLVDRKVLSRDQLELALLEERRTGVELSKSLAADGLVGERHLAAAVASQLGVDFWDPEVKPILPVVGGMVPVNLARSGPALPVAIDDGQLVVAVLDPLDLSLIEQVAQATKWRVRPLMATKDDIDRGLDAMYGEPADGNSGVGPADVTRAEVGFQQLLTEMVSLGASDLHLSVGLPPCVRIDGGLRPMGEHEVLTGSDIRRIVYGALSQRQREHFEANLELDTSLSVPDVGRFRLNVFLQKDAVGAVARAIPFKIVPLAQLGVPAVMEDVGKLIRGLVLVTGPTGSGKSTTLASLVDAINASRAVHIMTVEDPIEFVHSHKRSVVNQREVGEDTQSFAQALKHVLRQDPDVILVGELRDLETISAALTAAETGHLVFGTLHTQDAPQSIDRIIDVFPSGQQQQVRVQLASSLQAVMTQQLLPTRWGKGRAMACELMIATPAIRNLIREGKVHQIYSSMQAGGKYGMQTMDMSLARLVVDGQITLDKALECCHHEDDVTRLVQAAR